MDDEPGMVDAVAGAGVLHHLSVAVDLDQARGGDLVVGHAVGVDEEVPFLARDVRRDVVVDQVVHPVVVHQAVARGEVYARFPLLGRDPLAHRRHLQFGEIAHGRIMHAAMLQAALAPRSIAVIGASDNPHKVGGRPILYLQRYGYRGAVYPVNPGRAPVQGLRAFPRLEDLPEAPELAIVAVAGEEAVRAVESCAAQGVKVAVVMASGFGETGAEGLRVQEALVETARRAGMRLIGPNCQGLANFATGVVANFSTIFHELEGRDGPVAIVSQSGANSQAIYQLVRDKGLGVRHVPATGNEADVTVAELAGAVLADPGVRLILLYMESIRDPQVLAEVAEEARRRDVPIVAMKAGRTASGRRAAQSHTGALATEDRVVDAFFERHAIWRAADPQELVAAAELYVSGRRPRGTRLVFVSNSGASCVMAADHAEMRGIPLAQVPKEKLKGVLPGFAALDNPIDVTGALLGNPKLV